jgi:hypothetical protein
MKNTLLKFILNERQVFVFVLIIFVFIQVFLFIQRKYEDKSYMSKSIIEERLKKQLDSVNNIKLQIYAYDSASDFNNKCNIASKNYYILSDSFKYNISKTIDFSDDTLFIAEMRLKYLRNKVDSLEKANVIIDEKLKIINKIIDSVSPIYTSKYRDTISKLRKTIKAKYINILTNDTDDLKAQKRFLTFLKYLSFFVILIFYPIRWFLLYFVRHKLS